MGQRSSQLQIPPEEASATENQGKSKDKRAKSRKSKRKSAEMERPIDQDLESARALMQMREDPIHDRMAPYYKDNHAASVQLMAESSPMRPSVDSYLDDTESIQKSESRKANHKKGTKKRGRFGNYEFTSSKQPSNEAVQYPDLPSTPPGQVDRSSPSPYRPNIPQTNALDEIPTDDEDVAAYEEYAKDTTSADPPDLSDHDIFSFSQQPPNQFDQDEDGKDIHATYQPPKNGYALPQNAEKQKRKKRKRRTDDETNQQNFAHERGQHIPAFAIEAFDDFPTIDLSSANMFHNYEGDDMPIDPELHSMNALPASADTTNLKDEDLNILQKNGASSRKHSPSQPRKRRRLEEVQGANTTDLPFMSPYAFQHDQENIQDQILPGFEDMRGHSSHEFGSPLLEKVADGDANFSGDELQAKKSARRKKNGEPKKTRSKKKRDGSQKGDEIETSTKDKVMNGGAFSAADGLQLDAFRENYCEANDMTIRKFNNLIQTPMRGNAQVTALFDELYEVLPYRSRMSVQKFGRRRFHNFLRGTWSAEDDEMLKHAVAEKGKAWKEVGESLDRMPDDCRDRWRNYLINSEHRNREQWTNAEVVNLCSAILECMQLMKEDRMPAREEGEEVPERETESDQEVEDMKHINWQSVSDRMGENGGGRSRLQCSSKWGQLKKHEQADYLEAIRESREIEKKKSRPGKNPWRMKLASKKIANMKTGDIHAFLQAVLDTGVPDEGNIPWKSLGDDEFRATWTSMDKKAAWSVLKEQVEGYESMDYRSVADDLLTRIINANALDERWDPELHGDVSVKKSKKERKASKRKGKRRGRGKGKEREEIGLPNHYSHRSAEFVYDSDDVEGDTEDPTRLGDLDPQGYNRYNALPRADDMDWGVDASNGAGSMTADGQDQVFNSQNDANGHLPIAGEVSPELVGRLKSALNAYEN